MSKGGLWLHAWCRMPGLRNKLEPRQAILLAIGAGLLGLLVFRWLWIAQIFGVDLQVERGTSIITIEYMLGPVLITHPIHLAKLGRIPNLWPMELLFLAALTVPYVGIAYGAAYMRRRHSGAGEHT
jgi:hypothetical protein